MSVAGLLFFFSSDFLRQSYIFELPPNKLNKCHSQDIRRQVLCHEEKQTDIELRKGIAMLAKPVAITSMHLFCEKVGAKWCLVNSPRFAGHLGKALDDSWC